MTKGKTEPKNATSEELYGTPDPAQHGADNIVDWGKAVEDAQLRRPRKLAIIGFTESKFLAPWTDPDFDFWGFNMGQSDIPGFPWTRWFELHQRKYMENHPLWRSHFYQHLTFLRSFRQTPLYVWNPEQWPDCPTVKAYPKELVEMSFPRGSYHQGSFDWLVALAIIDGYKEIHIYGWNNLRGGEPLSSRACLEYWLGVAEGRGIKIHVPDDNDLFSTLQLLRTHKQYGYDDVQLVDGLFDPIPGVR